MRQRSRPPATVEPASLPRSVPTAGHPLTPPQALTEVLDAYLKQALSRGPGAVEDFLADRPGLDVELVNEVRNLADSLAGGASGLPELPSLPGSPLPFERVGPFRLVRHLGGGGMGMVYLAEQEPIGRPVALKLMRPAIAASEDARRRFLQEARAIARLGHPHIVTVHAAGEEQGTLYLAMELVPGRSLDELLAEWCSGGGRPPASRFVRWGAEIARALSAAHAAGLIHRDVKPHNLRITPEGKAVLLDFGLARDLQGSQVSLVGAFQGSPSYASPEQVRGDSAAIDERTDVYSLGVTLYEALAGTVPFEGETAARVFEEILHGDPATLRERNPQISAELEAVVSCAMARDPERRYASAADLAEDLEALLEMRPVAARPAGAPRRLLKWVRRHPAVATASAVACAAVLALPIAVILAQQAALDEVITERNLKETALRESEGMRLAAAADLALEDDPALALLLGAESARRRPHASANSALLAALEACAEERTLIGHERDVSAALWLDGGQRAATASLDGSIRIWDPVSGKTERRIACGMGMLRSLAVSADGSLLAVGSSRQSVEVRDRHSGSRVHALPDLPGSVRMLQFSPSGAYVLGWSRSRAVRVWSLESGDVVFARGPEPQVRAASFLPDRGRLVLAEQANSVSIWEVDAAEPTVVLGATGGPASCLSVAPDGLWIAVGETAGDVHLFAGDGSEPAALLGSHGGHVMDVAFSADARYVASASHIPKEVRVWNVATRAAVARLQLPGQPTDLEFHPDGEQLAVATSDGRAHLWRFLENEEARPLLGHESHTVSVRYRPDGERVLTASNDATARIWNPAFPRLRRTLVATEEVPFPLVLDPELPRLAVGLGSGEILIRPLEDDEPAFRLEGYPMGPGELSFLPGGTALAATAFHPREPSTEVDIWDLGSGEIELTLPAVSAWYRHFLAVPQEPWLVSDDTSTALGVWDWQTGEKRARLSLGEKRVRDYVLSPSGAHVAVYGPDEFTATVFTVENGAAVLSLGPFDEEILSMGWPDDESLVCVGTMEGTVAAFAWPSGEPVFERRLHASKVRRFAFSPSGSRVCSVSDDETGSLFDPWSDGEPVRLLGHEGQVSHAVFLGEGSHVATLSDDETVRVWRCRDGAEVLVLKGYPLARSGIRRVPEGNRLLTFRIGGPVEVIELADFLALAEARAPRELSAVERERYLLSAPEEEAQLPLPSSARNADASAPGVEH